MKKVLFGAAIAVLGLSSCGQELTEVKSVSNLQDSLSYSYGAMFGESMRTQVGEDNADFNSLTFARAMQSAINGDSMLMTQEAMQATLQNYFTNIMPAKKAKADSIHAAEQIEVDAKILADIKADNSNIIETESGLLYEIIEAGDATNAPIAADTVSALYTGTFMNGEVFDSSEKHGNTPAEFPLSNVIPGWTEGLQLIGKGGKIKLWIPANLGYGDEIRIFDVELVDVMKAGK